MDGGGTCGTIVTFPDIPEARNGLVERLKYERWTTVASQEFVHFESSQRLLCSQCKRLHPINEFSKEEIRRPAHGKRCL
jgi:hypothetical protein